MTPRQEDDKRSTSNASRGASRRRNRVATPALANRKAEAIDQAKDAIGRDA
jgi:hypothetical protein